MSVAATPTEIAKRLHSQAVRLELDAARARNNGTPHIAGVFDRLARDVRAQVAEIAAQVRRAA